MSANACERLDTGDSYRQGQDDEARTSLVYILSVGLSEMSAVTGALQRGDEEPLVMYHVSIYHPYRVTSDGDFFRYSATAVERLLL